MFVRREHGLRWGMLALALTWQATGAAQARAQKPASGDAISVPQLMKNLDSDAVHVAASAARSLGFIFAPGGKGGEELPKVTTLLIERLDSPKGAELRKESAAALGRMRAASATEGLKKAMGDEDIDVAMAAGEAVGQILPVDEARAFLIGRAADGSESVLVASYHGLAPISKPEDATFLIQGLSSKNWRSQMDAVRGLQRAVGAGADSQRGLRRGGRSDGLRDHERRRRGFAILPEHSQQRIAPGGAQSGRNRRRRGRRRTRLAAPGRTPCGRSITWVGRSPATRCRW